MNRRALLSGAAALAALGVAGVGQYGRTRSRENDLSIYAAPATPQSGGSMQQRDFGSTGLKVSEVGYGAWGIGGQSYGPVERKEALDALSRAEELGCNFVDSALVYGASEDVLGEFLHGRRDRWVVATKYSGQPGGMTKTLEEQLTLLRTDAVDLYQIHWVPRGSEVGLYDELAKLKQAGKTRFIGVSLYTTDDIDEILARDHMDALQVPFNLLEPEPFIARVRKLKDSGKAVIVRSTLKEGFLTGKFKRDVTFPDPKDQRHEWSREQIERTVDQAERFRFLEGEAGSMVAGAARYALSFAPVSTVIMGTKSVRQAESNFGTVPGGRLSPQTLKRIRDLQIELGLGSGWYRLQRRLGWVD